MIFSANAIWLLCWDVIYRDVWTLIFFGCRICPPPQKCRPRLQLSNDGYLPTASIQSHQQQCQQWTLFCHGLKTSVRKEWVLLRVIQIRHSWFKNGKWKSTFIMHAHYAQLLRSQQDASSVRPSTSTSAATRNIASLDMRKAYGRVRTSLLIACRVHLYKKMCVKTVINTRLK